MPRVLLIGIVPEAVDTSDPDLPPGLTREKIAQGIEQTLADMKGRGWEAGFCGIRPDDSAPATITESLAEPWDCIVIGGGIRIPRSGLLLFEQVINAVHAHAPGAAIAFNTSPENSAEAAARWVQG